MCGISGLIHRDKTPVNKQWLTHMTELLVHRGPDASGIYIADSVGFGHRRLSIIDIKGGPQPMSSSDSTVTVTYNGEIYNFKQLKKELTKKGYLFQSNCDTEVLIHLWRDKGIEMVHDLWGMFSFAIHDTSQNQVFMAVDRFGQKPFYYHTNNNIFAFASEPRALLTLPFIDRSLNPSSLHHYLSFLAVSPPRTIYKNIQRLAGGRRLLYNLEDNTYNEDMWYHLNALQKSSISYHDAKEQLKELLTDATQIRLMSDVPLGTFLSGGIDSAIVTGLVSELTNEKVKTFTIGSEEGKWDERSLAQKAADHFKTDHNEKIISACGPEIFINMMEHMGEAFADSSLLPTSMVCSFAREQVTVALSGDGADEAFGGYDRYKAMKWAGLLDVIPHSLRVGILNTALALLPHASEDRSLLRKLRRFCHIAKEEDLSRFFAIISHMTESEKQQLYTNDFLELTSSYNSINVLETDFARSHGCPNIIDKVMNLDVHRYLQDDILVKIDRASMCSSLEVRSPFLDHRVIEFASSLPLEYKIQGRVGKRILKDTFKDFLPPQHTQAAKKGFAVPLGQWFRGPMKDMAHDLLLDNSAKQRNIFDSHVINTLLKEHDNKKYDHGQKIWALCAFEVWARQV